MKYDYLIVGGGLFGATIAYLLEKANKHILVIDKRNHIGGNCFTQNTDNIVVHTYGPHIFHTNDVQVWKFINNFVTFNNFVHRVKANYDNVLYSLPINLDTLYKLKNISTPNDAKQYLKQVCVKNNSPKNFEELALSKIGPELYEKFILGYTIKQWGMHPVELPSDIFSRLPINLNWDDRYFHDQYQGIPIGGYTPLFEKLLERCEVKLNVDFFDDKNLKNIAHKIIYTGKIDEYFDYCFGDLEYRTTYHKTELLHMDDFQGISTINYTSQDVPYTRIIEHKHFDFDRAQKNKTYISCEYSKTTTRNDIPCYPITTKNNTTLYNKYVELSKQHLNVIFGGRLATYKYLNMDQTIKQAFDTFKREIS